MKAFILTIVAATILGGFVGGEILGLTFSITGAAIGGVGLTTILLSLGAYFDYLERKKSKEALPEEMRAVFGRLVGRQQGKSENSISSKLYAQKLENPTKSTTISKKENQLETDIDQFVVAMRRLGSTKNNTDLQAIGKSFLPKFSNAYIAAIDAYVATLAGIARPGADGASELGAAIGNGASTICEFVLENKISHAIGKNYFDQVMEYLRFGLPSELNLSGPIMDFDGMLELHQEKHKKPAQDLKALRDTAQQEVRAKWIQFNQKNHFKDDVTLAEIVDAFAHPIKQLFQIKYPALLNGPTEIFWLTIFTAILESKTHSKSEINDTIVILSSKYKRH